MHTGEHLMNVFFPILGGLSTTQHLSTLIVDKFSTSSTSLRTQPYSEFIYAHKLWTTFPQQGMAGDNLSNISTTPGDNSSTGFTSALEADVDIASGTGVEHLWGLSTYPQPLLLLR